MKSVCQQKFVREANQKKNGETLPIFTTRQINGHRNGHQIGETGMKRAYREFPVRRSLCGQEMMV